MHSRIMDFALSISSPYPMPKSYSTRRLSKAVFTVTLLVNRFVLGGGVSDFSVAPASSRPSALDILERRPGGPSPSQSLIVQGLPQRGVSETALRPSLTPQN